MVTNPAFTLDQLQHVRPGALFPKFLSFTDNVPTRDGRDFLDWHLMSVSQMTPPSCSVMVSARQTPNLIGASRKVTSPPQSLPFRSIGLFNSGSRNRSTRTRPASATRDRSVDGEPDFRRVRQGMRGVDLNRATRPLRRGGADRRRSRTLARRGQAKGRLRRRLGSEIRIGHRRKGQHGTTRTRAARNCQTRRHPQINFRSDVLRVRTGAFW